MTATPLSVMTRRTMPTVVLTEVEMYSWDIIVKVNMLTTTCCENFYQGSGSYYLSIEHEEGKYVSNQPRHLKYKSTSQFIQEPCFQDTAIIHSWCS